MLCFGLRKRHQNWCHTVEVLVFSFQGSETEPFIWLVRHEAPIRSQYQRLISFSVIYRNLQASKTTFFLKKSLHLFFAAALRPARGLSSFSPSTPLQQHGGPKNDTVFQKIFLLYNRSLHPSKNDIGFVNPLKKLPISITTTLPPPNGHQFWFSFEPVSGGRSWRS